MSFQQQIDQAIKKHELYFLGDALPADWYAAFKAWLPLAQNGDPQAMYNVGTCFVRGDGTEKDVTVGIDWYRRAAEAGDARAMFALYERYKTVSQEQANGFLTGAVAAKEPRAMAVIRAGEREQQRLKQEQQAAQERDDRQKRWASVLAEVESCFARRDREGARRIAEQAVKDGLAAAGAVLAALDLKLNVEQRFDRKAYGSSYMVDGTSRYTRSTFTYHWIEGMVSNPSAYPLEVSFEGVSGRYRMKAGDTMNLVTTKEDKAPRGWGKTFTLHLPGPTAGTSRNVTVPVGDGQASIGGGGPFPMKWVLLGGVALLALLVLASMH
ncbi:TPA: sel1 repeat family protein [Burkholderia vietnamiensis]|nr:sel1 repeat family protein [Burkholderia vietnamiensis]